MGRRSGQIPRFFSVVLCEFYGFFKKKNVKFESKRAKNSQFSQGKFFPHVSLDFIGAQTFFKQIRDKNGENSPLGFKTLAKIISEGWKN